VATQSQLTSLLKFYLFGLNFFKSVPPQTDWFGLLEPLTAPQGFEATFAMPVKRTSSR
jgi:hypothetical protein